MSHSQSIPSVMGAQKPKVIRLWLLIVFIAVVVIGAGFFAWFYLMGPGKKVEAPAVTATDPTANWKIYNSSKYGLYFKYPQDWTVTEKALKENGDTIVTLTSPETAKKIAAKEPLIKEDMIFKYSEASALSDEVSSNTIAVWLKDQFSNTVTASSLTKETIAGIVWHEATMNADPAYYAMITSKDWGLFAIDFPNINAKSKLAETAKNILGTIKFTQPKSAIKPASSTYTNSTYGFSLTFPAEWKGYKTKEATFEGSIITYYFELPTDDSEIGQESSVNDAGYYSPFALSVYTLEQWAAVEASEGPHDTLIEKSDKYAFGWSHANGIPASDFTEAMDKQIQSIIESFKLI